MNVQSKSVVLSRNHCGHSCWPACSCQQTKYWDLPRNATVGSVCTLIELTLHRPRQALRDPGSWNSNNFWTVGICRRPGCHPYAPAAFIPKRYHWYSFLLEAGRTHGHSAAGRSKSKKNSHNAIENRTPNDVNNINTLRCSCKPPRCICSFQ
jgi:hypothetical protein